MRTSSVAARRVATAAALVALALSLAACAGAGPYSHAPHYVPLSDEAHAAEGAREYDPVMATRDPSAWRKGNVTLFGVVTGRAPGQGGASDLTLSVRRLDTRNLCDNMNDDDSCRVTVSDRDFGVVHALVDLRGQDDVGEHSVGAGSLVHLVGALRQDTDAKDGAAVLRASYYRHFPRFFYVTRAAAAQMRQ